MNTDEIALRVWYANNTCMPADGMNKLKEFAHALLAELSKDAAPVIASEQKPEWSYCPECGSEEIHYEEGDHKQCNNCHQEWFSTIDYSNTVKLNLQQLFTSPPNITDIEQKPVAEDIYKDAERYLWLKSQKGLNLSSCGGSWIKGNIKFNASHRLCANDTAYAPYETLDEAIDAAIAAAPKQEN